jgi:hypothetical protein
VAQGNTGVTPAAARDPFGDSGADVVPICKCGALDSRDGDPSRCTRGHTLTGHPGPALVVSERSRHFWAAVADARREITEDVLRDRGHTPADAPRALRIAADGLAQAVLLRDASFDRIAAGGGPFTSDERLRRVHAVWESASGSVERHVRLLGIERKGRDIGALSAADYIALQNAQNAGHRE